MMARFYRYLDLLSPNPSSFKNKQKKNRQSLTPSDKTFLIRAWEMGQFDFRVEMPVLVN